MCQSSPFFFSFDHALWLIDSGTFFPGVPERLRAPLAQAMENFGLQGLHDLRVESSLRAHSVEAGSCWAVEAPSSPPGEEAIPSTRSASPGTAIGPHLLVPGIPPDAPANEAASDEEPELLIQSEDQFSVSSTPVADDCALPMHDPTTLVQYRPPLLSQMKQCRTSGA